MTPPSWDYPPPPPSPIARHYAAVMPALDRLIDDSLTHTVPPAALDTTNVRDAVDRALGRTRVATSHGLPIVTDPAHPVRGHLAVAADRVSRIADEDMARRLQRWLARTYCDPGTVTP